ncbi:superoxide dismutase [Geothrix campi]|uniref:superoxide dismutase n=1 Tax=Geothrix campi TaxID=2966450 RepID=UPI0021480AD6|nr:Fe-Mn family superoxide dismutase [Geothrix sp. SG10]
MDRRTLLGTLAAGAVGAGLHAKGLSPDPTDVKPTGNPLAEYAPRAFDFGTGLTGLGKELLAEHLTLYKGYVTRTNALLKDVLAAEKEGKAGPMVQELRRRLGFEFSGMRLHELYFEALSQNAAKPSATHPLHQAIAGTWGSFDAWWAAFKATCTMTGIGWGALVKDPVTGRLMNAWLQDHENAAAVGTQALLVVDVWEHAYVKDYGATGRAKYVDAVKPLIDWRVVEKRF